MVGDERPDPPWVFPAEGSTYHPAVLRRAIDTLGGLWELLLLGARSGFRLGGPYWRWRRETAFGGDPERRPSRGERLRAVLDYGRWVYRMKRGRY